MAYTSAAVSLVMVYVLLMATSAGGVEMPPTEASLSLAQLRLKGQGVVKTFAHFAATPNDDQHLRHEGILQLEWAQRLAPWSQAKIVTEARGDSAGFTQDVTFRVPDTRARRSILGLKEAVLSLQWGIVEASLGKQIFAWSTADAYNPTDNLNPYDYLDVLDHEKLGVYAAAARLTAGPTNLHFVVVPVFTPSRLPLPSSRWTPQPPPGFVAVVDERQLPPQDLSSMQYAVRVKTTFAGWDVSASYYEGFENTPVVRRTLTALAPGVVVPRLTPVFTRLRIIGADFSTTYSRLEIHGESVIKLVEHNGRDDRLQSIVGVNYTWDDPGLRWLEQITFVLEYAHEVIVASRAGSPILRPGGASQLGDLLANNAFRRALVGHILCKFSEETQFTLRGTADFIRTPNYYVQLALTHKLSDALRFETGLDLINGAAGTFWGRWRDNDRVFCILTYFF